MPWRRRSAAASYTAYSQRDLRWCWKRVGRSGLRFYEHGCLITCLAMMLGRRPDELNDVLLAADAFSGANLRSARAAEILGLDYAGKVTEIERIPTSFPAIREVDYARDGGDFVRHFVLQLPGEDGGFFLVDPYGGVRRPLDYYRFISYRTFARRPTTAARGEAPPAYGASAPLP
jgi:hypothetical protein